MDLTEATTKHSLRGSGCGEGLCSLRSISSVRMSEKERADTKRELTRKLEEIRNQQKLAKKIKGKSIAAVKKIKR
jgi:hypothetical protein